MLQIEDGWRKDVVKLLNSEKELVGDSIYTVINSNIFEHATKKSKEWIEYITNYCSDVPWNEFILARITNNEENYTIEQAKQLIIFLQGFFKILSIKNKKESLNNDFI